MAKNSGRQRRKKPPGPSPDPEEKLSKEDLKELHHNIEPLKALISSPIVPKLVYNSEPDVSSREPLSREELKSLNDDVVDIHFGLESTDPEQLWINHKPSAEHYGQLVNLPEVQLLEWISERDDALGMDYEDGPYVPRSFETAVLDFISKYIGHNDAKFFERLAILLRFRREKRNLSQVKLRELGINKGRGRVPQPYDLTIAVPSAIRELLGYRGLDVCTLPERYYRITFKELQSEIQEKQRLLGMNNPPPYLRMSC